MFSNEKILFISGGKYSVGDTLRLFTKENTILECLILSCKGDLSFMEYTFDSVLISTGSYTFPLDTIKEVGLLTITADKINKYIVHSYFTPLRHGVWKYYKPNGEIWKEENYNIGLFLK
jgi:hypothetical protein